MTAATATKPTNGTAPGEEIGRDPLAQLRAPFPAETIGKLPRVTCRMCSDRSQTCQEHSKRKCDVCGNYISTAHIHLDYVGHAEVTDRLLSVDPEWEWEPLAFDERGMPRFILDGQSRPVGLWIRLTVAGVTRLGFGSIEPGKFDAEKQLIGDALRNAAMRFGVALNLWAKSELESEMDETMPASPAPTPPAPNPEAEEAMHTLVQLISEVEDDGEREKVKSHLRGRFGPSAEMDLDTIRAATDVVIGWPETAVVPEPEAML